VDADRQTRVAVIGVRCNWLRRASAAAEAPARRWRSMPRRNVPAEQMIAEFSKVAAILPAEELPVHDGANRLRDRRSRTWRTCGTGRWGMWSAGRRRRPYPGQRSRLWPLLWQDVPTGAIAGRPWSPRQGAATGHDPLHGLQNAIVKIVFLDARRS